ncbi:DegT/DnrJ/EryC1/StrS family aminotransferase [Nonlabens sp.]|uniref:DegT/DnrJ/EryC1/StrS family aminotransferase n=1 Tax=Nonlabens sp. TaxID=1888209 RepID=UPI0025FBECFE|nr:DegT/DnrJ/EryC1/StrS family aminotransferase [Nonlabens sp.]
MIPSYIPYLDLQPHNKRFAQQDLKTFKEIHATGKLIGGEWVNKFENAYASYCGASHCIGTANGLDALTIILKAEVALGNLPEKAKIVVPAHTYIATFLSILHAGMQPVPVDVEELTLTAQVLRQVDQSYDAIIAVDIYGKLVDDEVYAYAREKSIPIYCDTAQSHGAVNDRGVKSGNLARASAFSFYPTKNLGALGDAGAITTSDEDLAITCRSIANYGRSSRFVNDLVGINSRLDPLQAGFLINRLPQLDTDNQRRVEIAKFYIKHLQNNKVRLPSEHFIKNNVVHVFPVYVGDRKLFVDHLDQEGIGTSVHYEVPPHQQKALKQWNHLRFPVTEKLHRTEVSLPCHPLMTLEHLQKVVQAVNAY